MGKFRFGKSAKTTQARTHKIHFVVGVVHNAKQVYNFPNFLGGKPIKLECGSNGDVFGNQRVVDIRGPCRHTTHQDDDVAVANFLFHRDILLGALVLFGDGVLGANIVFDTLSDCFGLQCIGSHFRRQSNVVVVVNFRRGVVHFFQKVDAYRWYVWKNGLFASLELCGRFVVHLAQVFRHDFVKNKVDKIQNVLVAAEVVVEFFRFATTTLCVVVQLLVEKRWVATAETVDGLFDIPHHKQVVGWRQFSYNFLLDGVCVLILVHKHVLVPFAKGIGNNLVI